MSQHHPVQPLPFHKLQQKSKSLQAQPPQQQPQQLQADQAKGFRQHQQKQPIATIQQDSQNCQRSTSPREPQPSPPKIIGKYELGRTLGKGTFGKVKQAIHTITQQKVAIKIIEKSTIQDEDDKQRILRQVEIMKTTRHPNIIHLYEIIETDTTIYLVLEYAEQGELFRLMSNEGRLKERAAGRIFIQILNAVEYLHRLGIVHRDIKPQNILLDVDFNIKLIDYGLSNYHIQDEKLTTACGSPCYAPPEMLSGNAYNGKIGDVWSLGIIFYGMVCGTLPFEQANTKDLYKRVIQGFYFIPNDISIEAIQVIQKMLVTDPTKRITIQQIRKLSFFSQQINQIEPQIIGIIVGYHPMPIDNEIMQKMVPFLQSSHHSKQEIQEMLKDNQHNEWTTTYYLIQKQVLRQGGKTIVDLQIFLQSHEKYKDEYGRQSLDEYLRQQQGHSLENISGKISGRKKKPELTTSAPVTDRGRRHQNQLQEQQYDDANDDENEVTSTVKKGSKKPIIATTTKTSDRRLFTQKSSEKKGGAGFGVGDIDPFRFLNNSSSKPLETTTEIMGKDKDDRRRYQQQYKLQRHYQPQLQRFERKGLSKQKYNKNEFKTNDANKRPLKFFSNEKISRKMVSGSMDQKFNINLGAVKREGTKEVQREREKERERGNAYSQQQSTTQQSKHTTKSNQPLPHHQQQSAPKSYRKGNSLTKPTAPQSAYERLNTARSNISERVCRGGTDHSHLLTQPVSCNGVKTQRRSKARSQQLSNGRSTGYGDKDRSGSGGGKKQLKRNNNNGHNNSSSPGKLSGHYQQQNNLVNNLWTAYFEGSLEKRAVPPQQCKKKRAVNPKEQLRINNFDHNVKKLKEGFLQLPHMEKTRKLRFQKPDSLEKTKKANGHNRNHEKKQI